LTITVTYPRDLQNSMVRLISVGSIELLGVCNKAEQDRLITDALPESIILNQLLEQAHATIITSGIAHKLDVYIEQMNTSAHHPHNRHKKVSTDTQLIPARNNTYNTRRHSGWHDGRPPLGGNQDEIEIIMDYGSVDESLGGTIVVIGRRIFEDGNPIDAIAEHGFSVDDVLLVGNLWDAIHQAKVDGLIPRLSTIAFKPTITLYGSAWVE
jgi:hypothetical protein